MIRKSLYLLIAALASCSAFVVHVVTVEWLPMWVSEQMMGIEISPPWNVRYVAALTSIEYGIGSVLIYLACRETILKYSVLVRAVFLSSCLAMLSGALIRQPLMDIVVGNPLHVALVQNLAKLFVWLLLGFITVYGVELIRNFNLLTMERHKKA